MQEVAQKKKIAWLQMVVWFAIFMLMLLGILNRGPGFTDESDNFIGGMVLASGGSIYKDFVSQHMPVMYYICALLKLLGASTVYSFRLYFYIVLAILWTVVAIYYKKEFGIITSAGSGVFYITNMFTFYTCCILAEQIQSICFVILLMEFLLFAEHKRLTWKNCLMISMAIFLSFGSAFVSAFPIFAIALAFLMVAIQEAVKEKTGFIGGIKKIWLTFWPLIIWVLTPFAVLIVSYALEGNLSNFIYGAYTVNREIYPNYIAGYGSNIIMSFVEPVTNYGMSVLTNIMYLFTDICISKEYLAVIRYIICYAVNIVFWIDHARKKNLLQAFLIAYFTMMCGTRGFTHEFHSLPYVAVTMFMAAYLLQKYMNYLKSCVANKVDNSEKKCGKVTLQERLTWITLSKKVSVIFIVITILVYSVQYIGSCRSILLTPQNIKNIQREDENNISYWVNQLTDPKEQVLLTTIEPQILVEADRIPYRTGISAPWMYEAFAEEEIANLEENAPRIAVYTSEYNLWGYDITAYAADFVAYMEENYTTLDQERFPELYVRNDYYEEASLYYEKNRQSK